MTEQHAAAAGLTLTEAGIARLVVQGWTDHEVATSLAIAPRAVETHLTCVFRKLGVQSRTELALLFGAEGPSRRRVGEQFDQQGID